MCIDDLCLPSFHFTSLFNLLRCDYVYAFCTMFSFFCILFSVSDQPQYQFTPFNDPAIMSASFASPVLSSASSIYANTQAALTAVPTATAAYGPPPGLAYPNSESFSIVQGRESQVRVPSSACSAQILPPAMRASGTFDSALLARLFRFFPSSPPFLLPSPLV